MKARNGAEIEIELWETLGIPKTKQRKDIDKQQQQNMKPDFSLPSYGRGRNIGDVLVLHIWHHCILNWMMINLTI